MSPNRAHKSQISDSRDTPPPQRPFEGTRRIGGLDERARAPRAKEDQVLTRVRRAVTLAVAILAPVVPAAILIVGEGAKRWH